MWMTFAEQNLWVILMLQLVWRLLFSGHFPSLFDRWDLTLVRLVALTWITFAQRVDGPKDGKRVAQSARVAVWSSARRQTWRQQASCLAVQWSERWTHTSIWSICILTPSCLAPLCPPPSTPCSPFGRVSYDTTGYPCWKVINAGCFFSFSSCRALRWATSCVNN